MKALLVITTLLHVIELNMNFSNVQWNCLGEYKKKKKKKERKKEKKKKKKKK